MRRLNQASALELSNFNLISLEESALAFVWGKRSDFFVLGFWGFRIRRLHKLYSLSGIYFHAPLTNILLELCKTPVTILTRTVLNGSGSQFELHTHSCVRVMNINRNNQTSYKHCALRVQLLKQNSNCSIQLYKISLQDKFSPLTFFIFFPLVSWMTLSALF